MARGLNEIMPGKLLGPSESVVRLGCWNSLQVLWLLWKRPALAPLGHRVSPGLPDLPLKAVFPAALHIPIDSYLAKPGLFVFALIYLTTLTHIAPCVVPAPFLSV